MRREAPRRGLCSVVYELENINADNRHNELWQIRISEYVDGEMTPLQFAEFEEHLKDCEECRKAVESLRLTKNALRQLSSLTPPLPRSFAITEAQARRMRPRPLYSIAMIGAGLAAAFLVLMVALDLVGAFTVTTVTTEVVVSQVDVPTVGTVNAVKCPTPGESGSVCASGAGGGTTIYQPPPETRTIVTTSKDSMVIIMEVVLAGLVLTTASFAFVLRPRAPSRIRR